jgi:hypothetical protein
MSERAAEREPESPARPAPAEVANSPHVGMLELARHAGNAAFVRALQRDEAEWVSPWADEAVELGLKDDIQSKYSVKIRGPWSDPDLEDLKKALELLSATEQERVKDVQMVRVASIPGDPGADALTTQHEDGTISIQCADYLFGREAGKSGGRTVYGHKLGAYGITHEFGHAIHFPNYDAVAKPWRPIYDRLKKSGTKISSEPKGDPSKHPDFELLAEGFARFRIDPEGLKTADAGVHAFFSGGGHLKK